MRRNSTRGEPSPAAPLRSQQEATLALIIEAINMPRFWLKRLGQFMRRPGKRQTKALLSPLARYRRLEFEVLEARLAPTVVSAFDASTGLLSVTSDAADTISLAVDAGSGDVLVNNSANLTSGGPAAATAIQQIQISGSAQDNIFDL